MASNVSYNSLSPAQRSPSNQREAAGTRSTFEGQVWVPEWATGTTENPAWLPLHYQDYSGGNLVSIGPGVGSLTLFGGWYQGEGDKGRAERDALDAEAKHKRKKQQATLAGWLAKWLNW